ncbi:MAG: caspase family protein [Cyclobacteriaceae bacterium]|nr:caspase family protein [Cyclobacteriaceae bacterium]
MKNLFSILVLCLAFGIAAAQDAPVRISGQSKPVRLEFGAEKMQAVSGISESVSLNFSDSPTQRSDAKSSQQAAATTTKTAPPANKPNYYALLIGVEKYQYANAGLSNLNQPVKDAAAFKQVLETDYNFPAQNVSFLRNPTRDQIISAFEEMARKITPKDNLLIFYAGHGIWDERLKVGYWLPSDAKTDNKANWIANSTVRDYISGIQSKHTLLVTDACFSGSIFKTREVVSEMNEYAVAKIYQLPSRKAMTSGTLTTVPDQSKFMEYLLKRLRDNTSQYFTARQLFFSVETAVMNNTNTVPQFGVIQETGDEGGDFIFLRK